MATLGPVLCSSEASPQALIAECPWFAVRVRSRCEKIVSAALRGRGLEEFGALYRARRRWADRFQEVELPLFPGYVFCRFDPNERTPVLTCRGVVNVVSFGAGPAAVDRREMENVIAALKSGLPVEPWPFFRSGEKVRIRSGSLAGAEGLVLRTRNKCRIVISVTLLQRSIAVELDSWMISPVQ